jgi:creatinine amidohydrolase
LELPTYNLGELSPVDVRAYLEEKDVVMIPIASLEQHGPHLPLLTDTIQAEEVTKRAAERAQVLYTPTVWMGYSPQHMYDPGSGTGTITIRPHLLLELWYDVGRSLIHHGFNKLVFVNNHGSNAKIVEPLLRRLRYDTGAMVAMSRLYGERYLALIDDIMENPPEETPGWHSSELETSQVMAHDASLVKMQYAAEDRAQVPSWLPEAFIKKDGAPDVEFDGYQYFVFPMDHAEFSRTGVIGNPMRATAEKGEEALNRYADHLVKAIDEFRPLEVSVTRREFVERV